MEPQGVFEGLLAVIGEELKRHDERAAADEAARKVLAAEVVRLQKQLSRGWWPW